MSAEFMFPLKNTADIGNISDVTYLHIRPLCGRNIKKYQVFSTVVHTVTVIFLNDPTNSSKML